MPVFEYRCNDCKTAYEILHKGAERTDLIECPSCHSAKYTKKFSMFAASIGDNSRFSESPCASGACNMQAYPQCAGGACGLD